MNKKISSLLILIVISITIFFINYTEDTNSLNELHKNITQNKKETKHINYDVTQNNKKVQEQHSNNDIKKNLQSLKEEKTILFKDMLDGNNYILSLLSNQTIKEEYSPRIKYLPFRAKLKTNDKEYEFRLSLKDIYKDNVKTELFLSLYSTKEDKSYECEASFLKDLDMGYIHYLNIEKNSDTLSCYSTSKQKLFKISKPIKLEFSSFSKEVQNRLMGAESSGK